MIDGPTPGLDEGALRVLVPRVLASLVRRGEDFDAAEDALQEALLEAMRLWPEHPPREPSADRTAASQDPPASARFFDFGAGWHPARRRLAGDAD